MNKKVILTILDGWGLREEREWNAIAHAETPNFDRLRAEYPFTQLIASGEEVGLPAGQMGNSEVGHLNIGAGRVVETGLYRISQSIKKGEFENNETIVKLFRELKVEPSSNLHLLILASKGGVHSHLDHLFAFLKVAKHHNISPLVHLFSDGRDVAPSQFLKDLTEIIRELNINNARLATISGRYYSMDRDKNWDRLEKVLRAITLQRGIKSFRSAEEYVQRQYSAGVTDEFIEPAVSQEYLDRGEALKSGDKVVFLNFRPDRAKQLSHALVGSDGLYEYSSPLIPKGLSLYSMMDYEKIHLSGVFFPPISLENTLGQVISDQGGAQLRAAESEKYPHVTYFFDGGVERDLQNIRKIIVQSPKVGTYDKAPEMSIVELFSQIKGALETQKYDLVVINFANPDMVGHSGDFEATVKACSAVDRTLGELYELSQKQGYTLVVIADHGNADIMKDSLGKPHTAHTTSPVPFILCDKARSLRSEGKLGDIAPTILELLSISQPSAMSGTSLLAS
ncbi:2,3-bisphosphoglycerate-independent phosphoglycerate mutase [Candidatus Mycoplasma haematominutum]|uniref:2,3-bisphosphoglycerate-independent phosphoglycerate mutase n=1 Tax=Candidatus Mycoplasma haematominutum 'Birmingham 1' TaxID=1116213 RepID=G8C2K9_9MOLU|nr:2,3-bisphosphoglycerate-independent phosphoglycerate mutase [Candidatus Mycoplasma haematominutum]CCE66557.1 2,3-bisphosphoglycerate-independent phosphoglycerate mutase [Candidatus Mycoplasma haematominutum 'Birmingham 1']